MVDDDLPQVAEVIAAGRLGAQARTPIGARTAVEQLRWELIEDLRRKGLVLMDPLGHLDVITVGREARTRAVLDDLWNRVVQAVVDRSRYRRDGDWDGGGFNWSQAFAAAGDGTVTRAGPSSGWPPTKAGWTCS